MAEVAGQPCLTASAYDVARDCGQADRLANVCWAALSRSSRPVRRLHVLIFVNLA
jgi:hypothetical protein